MSFENVKLEDIKILSDEDEVVAEHQEDERLDDEQEEQSSEDEQEQPEPEASKANEEEGEEAQKPEAEEEEQASQEQPDFDSYIGERSEGRFKSWDEINESLSEAEQLKVKLQEYEDLGIDDFAKDMLKYRKETGDLTPYLEAKLTDYDKIDGREIYRKHLMQENPDYDVKAINRLLKREYDEVVKLSEDLDMLDAEEREELEGERSIIEARVSRLRKGFKESQEKFKAPEKKVGNEQSVDVAKQREDELNYMLEHPEVAKIKKEGKIAFDLGGDTFNVEVNAKEVEQLIQNPMALFNDFAVKDEKGNPKVDKNGVVQWNMAEMVKLFALRSRFNEIVQKAVSHGKSLSKEELERELENPPVPNSQKSQKRSKTLAEAAIAAGIKL